jgi:threonine/homoserine/homoserine lactone efflux protein
LIPLFMYPAAQHNPGLVIAVAAVFGTVTLSTMVAAVALTTVGLRNLKLPKLGRWEHAIAGASIAVCGGAISLLGI